MYYIALKSKYILCFYFYLFYKALKPIHPATKTQKTSNKHFIVNYKIYKSVLIANFLSIPCFFNSFIPFLTIITFNKKMADV